MITNGIANEALYEQKALASKPHFEVMDGLRGIAALIVVLGHSFKNRGYVPNEHLAVDLFFILSGFVIAYSYDDHLSGQMLKKEFLLRRFIRLYPMLFVGALGGIAIAFVHNGTNPSEAYQVGSILTSGGLSLLVLPYFGTGGISNSYTFSFNAPIWSLFFEVVANIAYVFTARRLTVPILLAIIVVGLAGVVWFGPLGGGAKEDFWAGFPRVACSFFGGVLLYKLRRSGQLPSMRLASGWLFLIILVVFCVPFEIRGFIFVPIYALLCFVIVCASSEKPPIFDKYYAFLGVISYPVYLSHWLTLYIFTWIGKKLYLMGDMYIVVVLAHLASIPLIGYAFARFYETPVRLFLSRRLISSFRLRTSKELATRPPA